MDIHSNLPAKIEANNVDEFLKGMAVLDRPSTPKLRLATVTLAGKEGKWYENAFNQTTKTYSDITFQDYTDGGFSLSPILTTFFCKWKYDEDAHDSYSTSEFVDTKGNPLDLFHNTFGRANTPGSRELIKSFADYNEFKAEYTTIDKLTGKSSAPYDFYVSVYAYHHGSHRIVKLEMRGASRGAWFDFKPELMSQEGLLAMCQSVIRVDSEQASMKTGETYYMAKFAFERFNTNEEMLEVMQATNELLTYLSFKSNKPEAPVNLLPTPEARMLTEIDVLEADQEATVKEAVPTVVPDTTNKLPNGQEINLDDIPF